MLVVETGYGEPNSNSYVDLQDASAYYKMRGYYVWEMFDEELKQAILVSSTLFIDSFFDWAGHPLYEDQGLAFPRTGIINPSKNLPVIGIPEAVKRAVLETGRKIVQKNDEGIFEIIDLLPDNVKNPIKKIKEKLDVMESETVYMTNREMGSNLELYPAIQKLIPKYLLRKQENPKAFLITSGWYGGFKR